jgi:acyl carrier protein
MRRQEIFKLVADHVRLSLGGEESVGPSTAVFGKRSPIDSIQLVSLIVDIEDSIHDVFGVEVALADQRAMSRTDSPFRDVQSLCDYIEILVSESQHER